MEKQLKWHSLFWFVNNPTQDEDIDAFRKSYDDDNFILPKREKIPIILLNGQLYSIDDYNIWVGHTNFKISNQEVATILNNIPGVETFNIVSNYRFQVCIGKLFNDKEVRKHIKDKLCRNNNDINFSKSQNYWAVINKDGQKKCVNGKSIEEVINKIPTESDLISKSW